MDIVCIPYILKSLRPGNNFVKTPELHENIVGHLGGIMTVFFSLEGFKPNC